MPDAETEKFKGEYLDESHYDYLIDEQCLILKPDGKPLARIVRGELKDDSYSKTLADKIKGLPDNRGTSTSKGSLSGQHSKRKRPLKAGYNSNTVRADKSAFKVLIETPIQTSKNRGSSSGNHTKNKRKLVDGTVSKTTQQIDPITGKYLEVNSGIIGYFDRYPRFPYARETSFLIKHRKQWEHLQAFIHKVDNIFNKYYPERYNVQKEIASYISPDWLIGDTAFSTITVNKNYRTACHKDAGDLKEGYGAMSYFQKGVLEGGYIVFPAYRVAIKLKHCDVILFDVHEWHGNTPIKTRDDESMRVTCVFYLRENLLRCGDAAYELNRAKKVRQIGKLYDKEEIQKAENIKKEVLKKHGY